MPGSRVSVLSYPSEGHTFGPTLSYVTEDRYVDPIIEGHNPVTPPLSFVTGDHYVNPILQVHNTSDDSSYYGSSLPVAADSVLSAKNEEILLNLPDHEIQRLLGPVQDEILSDESVLIIRDAITDASFSITAADMKNILVTHGRLDPDRENQYAYVEREKMSKNSIVHGALKTLKSVSLKMGICCLLVPFVLASVCIAFALTFSLVSKSPPYDGPVVLLIGGEPLSMAMPTLHGNMNDIANAMTMELYYPDNPAMNRLTNLKLLSPVFGFGGAMLNNHTVLLAGGSTVNNRDPNLHPTDTLIRINLKAGTVDTLRKMHHKRFVPGAAVFENKLFVCGGVNGSVGGDSKPLSSCEKYDIETDTWTTVEDMIKARYYFGLHVLNDRLLAIGGDILPKDSNTSETVSKDYNTIEQYNSTYDQWHIVGQTPIFPLGEPSSLSYDQQSVILCGVQFNNADQEYWFFTLWVVLFYSRIFFVLPYNVVVGFLPAILALVGQRRKRPVLFLPLIVHKFPNQIFNLLNIGCSIRLIDIKWVSPSNSPSWYIGSKIGIFIPPIAFIFILIVMCLGYRSLNFVHESTA